MHPPLSLLCSGVGEQCAYRTDIFNNRVSETTVPSPIWWLLYPTVIYMIKKEEDKYNG